MKVCLNCGKEIEMLPCPYCGGKVAKEYKKQEEK